MDPIPCLHRRRAATAALALSAACVTFWAPRSGATEASTSPLPPPVSAPVLPPADVRPPLPLPGESGRLARQASGACSAHDEVACGAVPSCAWVKVYGTVPGHPTAGFCHPRAAMPSDTGPGR